MTKATAEAIKAEVSKVYIANTYIFRGGSLRHTDKEFKTAIAAYKYLHKKMINYAGTTDATQTIEEYDGKTSTKIYENSTNGTEEKTTNAEIQTLIDKWNAEIDARITAKNTNALMIAYLDEYAVSVDAQEVAIDAEIENAEKANESAKVEGKIFTVQTQNGEIYGLPDGNIAVHGNKIFDLLNHELASFDTAEEAKKAAEELEKAFERGDKEFSFAVKNEETPDDDNNGNNGNNGNNVRNIGNIGNIDSVNKSLKEKILANADKLKAKLAEQKSRPRKKVICYDEDDFHNNVNFSEISDLQKDFKKFLKRGELKLAENVFNNIKLIFQAAA